MFKLNKIAVAACALAATTMPALAADIVPYEPAPIPVAVPAPVPVAVLGGWYLRGDIGYANQELGELDNVLFDTTETFDIVHQEFTGAPFMAAGVGYRFNNWFRVDATGEYRSKSEFNGADIYTAFGADGLGTGTNKYLAKKSEWLALANAYVDLGSWHGLSPFIGAGVGAANVKISSFSDFGVGLDGFPAFAYADDEDQWNFAWALYAGLGMDVTDNFTVELAYRYLDMGDGQSGDLYTYRVETPSITRCSSTISRLTT